MSQHRFLLDTNIISAMMRNPQGPATRRLQEVGQDSIATNVVVLAELQFGIRKIRSKALQERLDLILPLIPVLAMQRPMAAYYAEIRQNLAQQGTPIGPNDLLIAAHALSLNMTVVTANVSEFGRVKGLLVENWLSAAVV